MTEYRVRFTKWSRSVSDVYMTVEADSPQAAFERVRQVQTGEVDPTEAEDESEQWGKEYLDDSGFECMDNPADYGVVSEIISSADTMTIEHRSCHEAFAAKVGE